ncbi:MAG: SprB repeat-containing protein [Saprospiraceae bacterium]|nr:SprB repeat-containing protein [Saprospiraceae bacterium]
MKTLFFLIITFANLALHCVVAQSNNPETVRAQLENLNKYWKNKNLDYDILNEKIPLTNDVSLIQMHLSLVEKTLRNKTCDNLSKQQKSNRIKCCDILHNYWTKGVFPKNLYHYKRTPYFIDDFGTACAVGQLVISTGHADFANKISNENNYAYIEDMNYPELNTWADTYGFTIEELKWIQPEYGCINPSCENNTQKNVSCYGGHDGCIGVPTTFTLTNPPFEFNFYKFKTATNTWIFQSNPCDLNAATYKYVITNSLGNTEDFIYNITQPDSLTILTSSTKDNGNCNERAFVNVTGGNPPYTYLWPQTGDTTSIITGLCDGCYFVQVTDSKNCAKIDSTCIRVSVGNTDILASKAFFSLSKSRKQ